MKLPNMGNKHPFTSYRLPFGWAFDDSPQDITRCNQKLSLFVTRNTAAHSPNVFLMQIIADRFSLTALVSVTFWTGMGWAIQEPDVTWDRGT